MHNVTIDDFHDENQCKFDFLFHLKNFSIEQSDWWLTIDFEVNKLRQSMEILFFRFQFQLFDPNFSIVNN